MAEPAAPPATVGEGPVDTDLPCYQCGYNLRSLPGGGGCPECGCAIAKSTSLGPIKRWPLTAENACGWLSLGMLTCWICGMGFVLWLVGLGLLLRHLPNKTPAERWTNRAAWVSLSLFFVLVAALWVFPMSTRTPTLAIAAAVVLGGHYLAVMVLGLRLARDAKMPFAYGATLLLMAVPFIGVVALAYGLLYEADEDTFVVLLICGMCWLILSGFYWMGISGELGARRLELIRNASDPDRRKIKTKTV